MAAAQLTNSNMTTTAAAAAATTTPTTTTVVAGDTTQDAFSHPSIPINNRQQIEPTSSLNQQAQQQNSSSNNTDNQLENYAVEGFLTSPTGRKLTIGFKASLVFILTGILLIQQIQFRGTWNRSCDYNIKIWSTVWLARCLLNHIIVLVISILVFLDKYRNISIGLRKLQAIIFIFKLCWFLYGIKAVLVEERCNSTSGTWGLVLWWLEFSLTVAPCICLCLLCPIVLCFFWRELPMSPDQPQPTPEDVRKKLKAVKFAEISDELEARMREPPRTSEAQGGGEPAEETGLFPEIASTITGVPLPDMSQLRRFQSGILGRQPSMPPAPRRAQSATAGAQPNASVVGHQQSMSGAISCPICFCNFEPKDDIIQMPCDFRHVFHEECLFSWLEQSQQCPICRCNVVQSLQSQETQDDDGKQSSSNSTEVSNKHSDSLI